MLLPHHAIFAASSVAEVVVFCFAGYVVFAKLKNSFAESIAYGIIVGLMAVSFLFQIAVLFRNIYISIGLEAVFVSFSVVVLIRLRNHIRTGFRVVYKFAKNHPGVAAFVLFGWGYLALTAVLIPPYGQWDRLSEVFLIEDFVNKRGFVNQPIPALNSLSLAHLFLRFRTDIGIGVYGFLAYISIAFSTYALARRYSWPPAAFTVTLDGGYASPSRFACHFSRV